MKHVAMVFAVPLITACANTLSGVGGSDTFACKAPPGTTCTSVAGVYANAVANNLPSQRQANATQLVSTNGATSNAYRQSSSAARTPGTGSAIRSDPRILRIWLAPWEDSEGDLHDQAYLYVTVDSGQWQIEHNRAPIRQEFTPLKRREQSGSTATSESPSVKPTEPSTAPGGNDVQ